MTAPAPAQPIDNGLGVSFAELAVRQALHTIGRQLLRSAPRSVRSQKYELRQTDPSTWHTKIPVQRGSLDIDGMVEGALTFFDASAIHLDNDLAACLRLAITTYLRTVIAAGQPHDFNTLARVIHEAGCLQIPAAA